MKKLLALILSVGALPVKANSHLNKDLLRAIKSTNIEISEAIDFENVIPIAIIGSGPAGLTAALYGGRSKIHTVVFSGLLPGGQLRGTTDVQNWPAIEKKWGSEIMDSLTQQAKHFGAQIVDDEVTSIDLSHWPYKIVTAEGIESYALTVIIATGASPKRLFVEGEDTYWGNGVSKCALCDAPCFEDKDVVVVGGGDSAVEEALQLAPYAKTVTVLVRSNRMRAALSMQDRLAGFSNIKVEYDLIVEEIIGDGEDVLGIKVINSSTGEKSFRPVDGVFVAIGHNPNTELVVDQLYLDTRGYIVTASDSQETSKAGVFAAGEVHDDRYKQACIACGHGAMAALNAIEFLRDNDFNEELESRLRSRYLFVECEESA